MWTLNPAQMIGLPNRSHRTDLEKLVFLKSKTINHLAPMSCTTFWIGQVVKLMGIGNENDQVS